MQQHWYYLASTNTSYDITKISTEGLNFCILKYFPKDFSMNFLLDTELSMKEILSNR